LAASAGGDVPEKKYLKFSGPASMARTSTGPVTGRYMITAAIYRIGR